MKREVRHMIGLLVCLASFPCETVNAQGRGPSARELRDRASVDDNSPAARAAKLAELEKWLARLAGRYRIEAHLRRGPAVSCGGPITSCGDVQIGRFILEASGTQGTGIYAIAYAIYAIGREATGIGDCVGIGTGSGVHCVFNVPWPAFEETDPWGGYPIVLPWKDRILDPAVFLFGMDPDNSGIRYLAVDGQSIAEEAWGYLKGDTIHFELPCGKGHDSYGTPCERKFWIRCSRWQQACTGSPRSTWDFASVSKGRADSIRGV